MNLAVRLSKAREGYTSFMTSTENWENHSRGLDEGKGSLLGIQVSPIYCTANYVYTRHSRILLFITHCSSYNITTIWYLLYQSPIRYLFPISASPLQRPNSY